MSAEQKRIVRPLPRVQKVTLSRRQPLTFLLVILGMLMGGGSLTAQAPPSSHEASGALPSGPAPGDVVVATDKSAASDLIGVGHSIFVDGEAKGAVAALGGSVNIRGRVDGDVVAFGGDVWLSPEASVEGDVIVLGGRLYHPPGSKIGGKTLATTYFRDEFHRAFTSQQRSITANLTDRTALLWRAARVLAWFIIAVLVILFVPVQTAFAMDRFERDFARIAVIGLLALVVFIGLLALFSLLIKIVVGVPLVFLLMLSLFTMWGFGAVAFYLTIGRLLVRWIFKRPLPMALYALLGLVAWSVLSFIPVVNLIIPYIVFILALGISLATKMGTGKPWFVRS